MKIMITETKAKLLFPKAFDKIPERWQNGSMLSFYIEGENLSMRSGDGLHWEWTIYGRWIRIT